jgi:hypothetical protein
MLKYYLSHFGVGALGVFLRSNIADELRSSWDSHSLLVDIICLHFLLL